MIPADNDKSGDRYSRVLAFAVLSLILAIVVAGSLRLKDTLGPETGDVFTFSPTRAIAGELQTAVTAARTGDPPGSRCMLDPEVMERAGGSLVIEATQFDPDLQYRVHWAGAHTSDAGADCGASADLLLSPSTMTSLSLAADHWGQAHIGPTLPDFSVQ